MTGKYNVSKRLKRFLLQAKSYLNHQWKSVLIALLITCSAYWLESFISKETLELLFLGVGFTIGVIFIFVVNVPWVALITSLLVLFFHCYSHFSFLRQVALAVLIGGCVLSLLDILRKSKK